MRGKLCFILYGMLTSSAKTYWKLIWDPSMRYQERRNRRKRLGWKLVVSIPKWGSFWQLQHTQTPSHYENSVLLVTITQLCKTTLGVSNKNTTKSTETANSWIAMLNIFMKILKSWITMQTKIEELKPSSTYFLIVLFCEILPCETEESPLSHFQLSKHCSNTCAKWIPFHFLTAQVRKNEAEKKKKKKKRWHIYEKVSVINCDLLWWPFSPPLQQTRAFLDRQREGLQEEACRVLPCNT